MSILKEVFAWYFLIINVVMFLMMGIDKKRAQSQRYRIPENTLFFVSILGGCIGGLIGMKVFRHKTKKPVFHVVFWLSAVLHAILIYFIITKL